MTLKPEERLGHGAIATDSMTKMEGRLFRRCVLFAAAPAAGWPWLLLHPQLPFQMAAIMYLL